MSGWAVEVNHAIWCMVVVSVVYVFGGGRFTCTCSMCKCLMCKMCKYATVTCLFVKRGGQRAPSSRPKAWTFLFTY
jgi:hypothetical protein